jgi:hypothetical protein
MKNKRGDFNFALLFAIIAGSAILLLAIYGAVKAGNSAQVQSAAEVAKEFDIITNPLQGGFAPTKTSLITFPKNTRIENTCSFYNDFGYNSIAVQSEVGTGDKWLDSTIPVRINNKYIYSDFEEGKSFRVMSKSFEFPYKVADLLFITSKNYCFMHPPAELAKSILSLSVKPTEQNFIGVETDENNTCFDEAITVCFEFGNCDIVISGTCNDETSCDSKYDSGTVRKNGETMTYEGNLLFAALFSSKEIYDCNFQRLMFRTSKIADILSAKADLMNARGCNTQMKLDMEYFSGITKNGQIEDLRTLSSAAKILKDAKQEFGSYASECDLW